MIVGSSISRVQSLNQQATPVRCLIGLAQQNNTQMKPVPPGYPLESPDAINVSLRRTESTQISSWYQRSNLLGLSSKNMLNEHALKTDKHTANTASLVMGQDK